MDTLQSQLENLLSSEVAKGTISRASLSVVSSSATIVSTHTGVVGSEPISENTRFDIASVTKTVPVSTLALMALDQNKISLEMPVADFIPGLKMGCQETPRLNHLLTQTLDFGFSLAALKDLSSDQLLESILTADLKAEPGKKFYYCNATSILLGLVVEKIYGTSLDRAAHKYLFDPLGMDHTLFRPSEEIRTGIVPTEICPWRNRPVQGEIHDESAWTLNQTMIPGAAGLFSTTADLGRYLQMILNDGEPLFSSGFIQMCAKNHIHNVSGTETALGFEFNQPYMGTLRSKQTIGKTGFTGSVIVADLIRKVGFTLLTDYTWPQRKASKDGIVNLRQKCADLIYAQFPL